MATIGSANSSSYENTSRRSYISTMAFNSDFFTYTTSVDPTNFVTTGTLTTVSGATAGNSPLGRVLRETGRKLIPGANPGITVYMVEVFDNTTFLRGYINPNSPVFAPFNSDKPAFMEDPYVINQDVSGGTYSGLQNYGASTLTRGNVIASGQIRCSQQNTATVAGGGTYAADIGSAQTYYLTFAAGGTINASNMNIGDRATFVIKSTSGGTIAFGTNFLKSTSLILGAGVTASVSFHGTNTGSGALMVEVSRTGALA
jgi:hypothetical protein